MVKRMLRKSCFSLTSENLHQSKCYCVFNFLLKFTHYTFYNILIVNTLLMFFEY